MSCLCNPGSNISDWHFLIFFLLLLLLFLKQSQCSLTHPEFYLKNKVRYFELRKWLYYFFCRHMSLQLKLLKKKLDSEFLMHLSLFFFFLKSPHYGPHHSPKIASFVPFFSLWGQLLVAVTFGGFYYGKWKIWFCFQLSLANH